MPTQELQKGPPVTSRRMHSKPHKVEGNPVHCGGTTFRGGQGLTPMHEVLSANPPRALLFMLVSILRTARLIVVGLDEALMRKRAD